MAIKEIQLSNIPKSEIGQIMVRLLSERPATLGHTECRLLIQSEIDLLKNLNVRHVEYDLIQTSLTCRETASKYCKVQGFRENPRLPLHHSRVRLSSSPLLGRV